MVSLISDRVKIKLVFPKPSLNTLRRKTGWFIKKKTCYHNWNCSLGVKQQSITWWNLTTKYKTHVHFYIRVLWDIKRVNLPNIVCTPRSSVGKWYGVTFTKSRKFCTIDFVLSVVPRQFHKACRNIDRKLRISSTTKYYDRSYDHTYDFLKNKIPWQRYFHFWQSCAMDTSDVNKNIVC